MNRCHKCCADLYQEKCPLCGSRLGEPLKSVIDYPQYGFYNHKKKEFIKKLILFLTISTILITVYINAVTFSSSGGIWSLTVCASLGLVIYSFNIVKSKKIYIGGKIFRLFFAVSLFIVFLDVVNGFLKWSTTYVVSFLTIVAALLFTVLAFIKKNNIKEYFGYILAIAFLSLCPIMLYIFGLSDNLWSSLVATLACVIITIGLYIFTGRSFKEELKKRFHC